MSSQALSMHVVLLPKPEASLISAARSVLPDAEVKVLSHDTPLPPDASAWCFIDWLGQAMSGIEICRRLRALPQSQPPHITMVIEGEDPQARARALAAGADDYMPGPLDASRLAERLRFYTANLEQSADQFRAGQAHKSSGLLLDPAAHQVRWQGRLIPLRPREFRLLALFMSRPDRLLSRTEIIERIGDAGAVGDERTVDVWIGRLRRTLEAHGAAGLLRTVRSMGYVFDTPVRDTTN